MGPVGLPEMIAIFVIALILFGPKKLPELGRTLGKALSEFRRAKNELKNTLQTHLDEIERETRASNSSYSPTRDYSSKGYSYPYEDYKYDQLPSNAPPSETPALPPSIEAPSSESVPDSAPVAGTVARNNGVHPVEPASVAPHEDRPV